MIAVLVKELNHAIALKHCFEYITYFVREAEAWQLVVDETCDRR